MKKVFGHYSIAFGADCFSIRIGGLDWFTLPVSTAVDTKEAEDIDREALSRSVTEEAGRVQAVYCGGSNLWEEKIYRITADEQGFHYTVHIKGKGRIRQLRYFCGRQPAHYEVSGYLLPVATHKNRQGCTHNMLEENEIGLGYFAPPPFVFPFFTEGEHGWFGLGLTAKPGQYNFDRFVYRRGLCLQLPLYNRTVVDGAWEAQGIWGGYGADALDVVAAYSEWHYRTGLCARRGETHTPDWWRGPIFCGWGEQQTLARNAGRDAVDFATQRDYTRMLQTLKDRGLHPRILIIDAKWQESFGNNIVDTNKWPDLRGFTDAAHRDGIKVLLWIRSFNAEGLPQNECVTSLTNPIAADPANPAFIERTQRNIHTLLSDAPGCCNCDGFKVDFINCIPSGENIETYVPGMYGVELVKRWLHLLYTASKAAKPEALLNVSCAHPYMAEDADQIRIHDYHGELNAVCSVMGYRAGLAKAVYPGITIDCDSGGTFSHRDFLRYMRYQPEIGVPDLYWLSPSYAVPFSDADFAVIRDTWAAYEQQIV